jgi:hypothetical protein
MNNLQSQLKYGFYAGVALIIIKYILLTSFSEISMASSVIDYLLTMAVLAIASFMAFTAQRKENGGVTTFREVFFIAVYISFIAALFSGAFQFFYSKYIDPARAERMVNKTIEYMKSLNATDSEIKSAAANARIYYSPGSQFLSGVSTLIYGLFVSLIIALAAKKDIRNNKTVEES